MAATHRSQINVEVDERAAVALRLLAMSTRSTVPELVRGAIDDLVREALGADANLQAALEAMLASMSAVADEAATVTELETKKRRGK